MMAWEESIKTNSINIVPDIESSCRAMHANLLRGNRLDIDRSGHARLRVEKVIRVCFAGPIAQRNIAPRTWHGEFDFELAADLIMRIPDQPKRLITQSIVGG